ncbi:unnamed protein product [Urochloa humidicola]
MVRSVPHQGLSGCEATIMQILSYSSSARGYIYPSQTPIGMNQEGLCSPITSSPRWRCYRRRKSPGRRPPCSRRIQLERHDARTPRRWLQRDGIVMPSEIPIKVLCSSAATVDDIMPVNRGRIC